MKNWMRLERFVKFPSWIGPRQLHRLIQSQSRQNALVVCATHEEIDRVTEAIRSARKKAGELGKSVQLTRDVSLNWTTAQKSEMQNFRPGQLLGFHRAVKGIAKNETVEVMQVENKRLIVRNEHGRTQTVTAKQAKSFDVLERKDIEVAPGDKLLLTANYRTQGFRCTNGEIVTVSQSGFQRQDSSGGWPHPASQFQTIHSWICCNGSSQPGQVG